MPPIRLTAEQQAAADRIHTALTAAAAADLRALAELLAAKADADLFGATEFQVRDLVHQLGAKAIEAALAERKKRATTAPAAPARGATSRPSSSAGGPKPS